MDEKLVCAACGTEKACDCTAPYVTPAERAAAAVAADPTKSDRSIAASIGVDHKTVAKARTRTGEKSPVEKRQGRDGRKRRLPAAPDAPPPRPVPADPAARRARLEKEYARHLAHWVVQIQSIEERWSLEIGDGVIEVDDAVIGTVEMAIETLAKMRHRLRSITSPPPASSAT